MTCKDCKWHVIARIAGVAGTCHRSPPEARDYVSGVWPFVPDDGWCGEFISNIEEIPAPSESVNFPSEAPPAPKIPLESESPEDCSDAKQTAAKSPAPRKKRQYNRRAK